MKMYHLQFSISFDSFSVLCPLRNLFSTEAWRVSPLNKHDGLIKKIQQKLKRVLFFDCKMRNGQFNIIKINFFVIAVHLSLFIKFYLISSTLCDFLRVENGMKDKEKSGQDESTFKDFISLPAHLQHFLLKKLSQTAKTAVY